ncbi:sensor histidine kinase N-terminal domain-containing protein [Aquincola sp. S2]|uniref:histidine kinase n=1 Tax=Pseudaquabacterium terrae TaxID=2732868 RepID=A0ABX2EQ98_9BURK|nr:ATP-binding protein [Aquabacterium terrae]NRF70827.1 sensor histidine kinase N-terminal domain-containing protein [Aquabacterium terrae]
MRSLERQLLAWLLAALLFGTAVLATVSYVVTLEEVDETFDDSLRQIALAVAGTPGGAAALPPRPARAAVDDDRSEIDFVTQVWTPDGQLAYSSHPGLELPFSRREGHARIRGSDGNGGDWHRYTVVTEQRVVQVAQRADERSDFALDSALTVMWSLAAMVGVLAALLVAALRRGLRPLGRATRSVAERSATSLEPIGEAGLPRELQPLLRAINELLQRLSEALATQRRFVADAAHELRTPVTALRLQLQLLQRADDEADRAAALAELASGIERAQHLIEQLLHLSRLEPDAATRPFEPVDLGALARAVVGSLSIKADHKGIDLGADAEHGLRVPGDVHQLTILLSNLVENALRHGRSGGIVDVRADRLGPHPMLQVIDDGPGIAASERARVFDRFYRGEGARAESADEGCGSGLGLAIVKAIAQRHGADVSLHDGPAGRGLEVRVVFAAAAPPAAAAA